MQTSTVNTQEPIAPSELVLNPDGSIYHLKLRPEQLADTVILVGDPGRVARVSSRFDSIEHSVSNREFVTHTGTVNGQRLSVLSTGIGTDNIDIVINELDALVNIDLETRLVKDEHKSLNLIRIGTSGALHPDIDVDTFVFSAYGMGLDGVANFYQLQESDREASLCNAIIAGLNWPADLNQPYIAEGSSQLLDKLGEGQTKGITVTANGFYGPQGRVLRLPLAHADLNERFRNFEHSGLRITNYEMETSALYALGGMLGHHACTACAIIANRYKEAYSKDYKVTVEELIDLVIHRITN